LRESRDQSVQHFDAEQLRMPHHKMSLVDLVHGHSVRPLPLGSRNGSTAYKYMLFIGM